MNEVLNGIDRLKEKGEILRGKRIGLVTNPSGVARNLQATLDILAKNFRLTALFAPEHGVRGNYQNGACFTDTKDPQTGIPVFALYGHTPRLSAERLAEVDLVAWDIQDIGSRGFSYFRTLGMLMEDCIAFDRPLVIFDRINPIGGEAVEGILPDPAFEKNWGYGLPARFGLTTGEYARFINAKYFGGACRLDVIPCSGWKRSMYGDDCGLQWINPSPNIPNVTSALIYAGCAAFGQTNVSEARGTTRPYEMYGAPFIDGMKLARRLNGLSLAGVVFRECSFTPEYNMFRKHVGELCSGVQVHITDKYAFDSFACGVWMMEVIREDCAAFKIPFADEWTPFMFDSVLGSDSWRTGRESAPQLLARAKKESSVFRQEVKEFLLY